MTEQCWEYVGHSTATQQRRQCSRPASWTVNVKGMWIGVCGHHVKTYADLPRRKLG